MAHIAELDRRILQEAFPNLRFNDDLDIERYFELRQAGQMQTALSIYNGVLKRKYPDEQMRVKLLTFYRTHDARFHDVLTENLQMLANTTTEKIKKVITYITDTIAKVDTNDVFSLIQIVEGLVSAFGNDRFQAISETEKFTRFADILGYKNTEMREASEFIRKYVTDTLTSVNEYRNEQARLKRKQLEDKARNTQVQSFDFSKIVFTKEQVSEIVLPNETLAVEDKVLAYIAKYWDKAFDARFENMILLYSRKYKTKHYDIFNSIKIGRARNWQDSELLQSVLANVVTGYYYSISGDLYLHKNWQRIKAVLKTGNTINWAPKSEIINVNGSNRYNKPLLLPSKVSTTSNEATKLTKVSENSKALVVVPSVRASDFKKIEKDTPKKVSVKKLPSKEPFIVKPYYEVKKEKGQGHFLLSDNELRAEQKKQEEKYALMKKEEADFLKTSNTSFRENARLLAENEKSFLERQRLQARKTASEVTKPTAVVKVASPKANTTKSVKKQTTTIKSSKPKEVKVKTSQVKKTRVVERVRSGVSRNKSNTSTVRKHEQNAKPISFFVPRKNNNFDPSKDNSVEQMIKNATGKNYVIHKDLFFKSVRTSIRHILGSTSMKKQSLFKSEQNMAENIIYVFLQRNYSNIYQDWETSNAKDEVYQLGFNVRKLDAIIKHWVSNVLKS